MDTNCPGCGEKVNDTQWDEHSKQCNKLAEVIGRHQIPSISMKDITALEIKSVPNDKGFGIWNKNKNDWIRDNSGNIDSRLFLRNLQTFKDCIIVYSILGYIPKQTSSAPQLQSDDEYEVPDKKGDLRSVLALILSFLIIGGVLFLLFKSLLSSK